MIAVDKKVKMRKRSRTKIVWDQFRKSNTAMLGLGILSVFLFFAIFANVISDYETNAIATNEANRFLSPSFEGAFTGEGHLFGTDEYGRDVFSRIIHGSRISLSIGIITTSFAAIVGGMLGAIAAFFGKKTDFIIMRFMDIISSIPSILLAMAVVAALGANLRNLLLALGFSSIAIYARLVRSAVVSLVDQEYIEASRAFGSSDLRIIVKHIIPNSLSPIVTQMAFSSAGMILTAASMSYLGLGIQAPAPEWGAMLSSAKTYIWSYPHLITIPGICIVLAALSITLIGDGLRDALDPRLKD